MSHPLLDSPDGNHVRDKINAMCMQIEDDATAIRVHRDQWEWDKLIKRLEFIETLSGVILAHLKRPTEFNEVV